MSKALVVVESPAKAKTIKKYLGPGYEVMASKGHIKDLPKKMGIDVEKGFQETYVVIESKEKVVQDLKAHAKKADQLLLATDPDREGEAIAFHIAQELKHPNVERVEFHEITKRGVQHGMDNPRALDASLYDAQRARRVLDRIVGYDVSALVWSKLAFGLSAGRVQSVALRLIVEKEREIEAFVPDEYWNIGTALKGKAGETFAAKLAKGPDGKKLECDNGELAQAIRADLESSEFKVGKITRRDQKRNAPAPYTTSKIQQDATNYLRFTAKRTMTVAQKLYEGIDLKKEGGQVGLITYMRTDSMRVSPDAISDVRTYIGDKYGKEFLPAEPNTFKARKSAQEAHEAIRPTDIEHPPEKVKKYLTDEQYKLYKLIWDRFVASQMKPALYDQTGADIDATPKRSGAKFKTLGLRASGKVLKFSGWLEQYGRGVVSNKGAPASLAGEEDTTANEVVEGQLPRLDEGELLTLVTPPGVNTDQKFTQPPARYNEGSLVRELEKRGIGRPSTYAEIISKVQARAYVEKLASGGMQPSPLGMMIVDGLVGTTLDFMDPDFTAKMEEDLDEVEAGKLDRVALLKRFYKRFREELDVAKKQDRWAPEPEPTDHKCDECGSTMLKRWSKNGFFLGCENYPKCKFTQNITEDGREPEKPIPTDYKCEEAGCGKPMVIRQGRYGEFLSCSGYPECKHARPVPTGVKCPECKGDIIEIRPKKKGGRKFYGCSNYQKKNCEFKLWQKPINEACPDCKSPYLVVKGGKNPKIMCPTGKDCGYSRPIEDESEEGEAEAPVSEERDGPGANRPSSAA